LDGKKVGIDFNSNKKIELMIPKTNYLDENVKEVTYKFIQKYFSIFDNDREDLLYSYDKEFPGFKKKK
jgi:hypothetical protein